MFCVSDFSTGLFHYQQRGYAVYGRGHGNCAVVRRLKIY